MISLAVHVDSYYYNALVYVTRHAEVGDLCYTLVVFRRQQTVASGNVPARGHKHTDCPSLISVDHTT